MLPNTRSYSLEFHTSPDWCVPLIFKVSWKGCKIAFASSPYSSLFMFWAEVWYSLQYIRPANSCENVDTQCSVLTFNRSPAMTACKSAVKDKQKTNVRQKVFCIWPLSWEHTSQYVWIKTNASIHLCTHILPKLMRTLDWHVRKAEGRLPMLSECYMDIKAVFPMLPWNFMLLSELLPWSTLGNFQQCSQVGAETLAPEP